MINGFVTGDLRLIQVQILASKIASLIDFCSLQEIVDSPYGFIVNFVLNKKK